MSGEDWRQARTAFTVRIDRWWSARGGGLDPENQRDVGDGETDVLAEVSQSELEPRRVRTSLEVCARARLPPVALGEGQVR